MKTKPFLTLIALLLGCSVHAQNPPPPAAQPPAAPAAKADAAAEIGKLQEGYNTAMEANAGENAKWIEGLEKWYFDGLDKLKADRAKAGDLDGAVLVKTERDRVTMHTETTPEQIKAMPAALRTLRGTYEGSLKRIIEETGKKNLPVSRKFLADLEALQKRITVTGNIEQALIVKEEKERFAHQFAESATVPSAITENPGSAKTAILPVQKPAAPRTDFVEHISALTNGKTGAPILLKKKETMTTKAKFKPPVEILIEAKTNSTNLRLGYAADEVIFNWENSMDELRVDGGPANKMHQKKGGLIPTNTYVTIRWVVTPKMQSIYVDGERRFEHHGDYSGIDKPISVSSASGSIVTVKSVKVRQLPPEVAVSAEKANPPATAHADIPLKNVKAGQEKGFDVSGIPSSAASSIPSKAAGPQTKVQITTEKKPGAVANTAVGRAGSQTKSAENILYVLTLKNISPNDLPGLTVDYLLFVERQRLGEVKNEPSKVERIAASRKVEVLTRENPQVVTTSEVPLNVENLVGHYHYRNGGRIRAEDSVIGVWVRVTQDGQLIGEYANPPTVTKRGWGGK